MRVFSENRKARHDYFIEEKYECGIVLHGTEVKSIRAGRVNLKESYCIIRDSQIYILGMHISPYEQGSIFNVDPLRERVLLMHKREIRKLDSDSSQKGYSIVPLRIYANDNGKVKMEIALVKGKHNYDKRQAIADKDAKRTIEREISKSLKYS